MASISPISSTGHLARFNLATGQVSIGPALLSASDLLVVGKAVAVLSPSATEANGVPEGPYRLRFVLGHSVALGSCQPEFYSAEDKTLYLLTVFDGRGPLRRLVLRGEVFLFVPELTVFAINSESALGR